MQCDVCVCGRERKREREREGGGGGGGGEREKEIVITILISFPPRASTILGDLTFSVDVCPRRPLYPFPQL